MLEMKNVTKTFGKFKALDDLSMTVPKGSVYGLVGPNGAGKSTAIRLMTGIYRPDSGEITLEGKPVYENPENKIRIVKAWQRRAPVWMRWSGQRCNTGRSFDGLHLCVRVKCGDFLRRQLAPFALGEVWIQREAAEGLPVQ